MPTKPKGHWPRGKRRHPEPSDWQRIRAAMDEAANRRQMRLVAKKIGVHPDTIIMWRKGTLIPAPERVKPLMDALYALKLYWQRSGRKSV